MGPCISCGISCGMGWAWARRPWPRSEGPRAAAALGLSLACCGTGLPLLDMNGRGCALSSLTATEGPCPLSERVSIEEGQRDAMRHSDSAG